MVRAVRCTVAEHHPPGAATVEKKRIHIRAVPRIWVNAEDNAAYLAAHAEQCRAVRLGIYPAVPYRGGAGARIGGAIVVAVIVAPRACVLEP